MQVDIHSNFVYANGGAAYSDGVTNNGAQSGNVVFNVQHDAPAQLYYQCTITW